MNIKLSKPKSGYSVEIKFENPICDIGKATAKTIKMPFLNLMLKLCSNVLLIE